MDVVRRYAGIAVRVLDLVAGRLNPALLATEATNALTLSEPPSKPGHVWVQDPMGKARLTATLDPRYLLFEVPVDSRFTDSEGREGPSPAAVLYAVRVTETREATFYVLADSEDAALEDAHELASDLDTLDYRDGDVDAHAHVASYRSGGMPIWTGGPGGKWIRYGEEHGRLLDRYLPVKVSA